MEWIVEAYSDSDFAEDTDERKNITGYIVLVAAVPFRGSQSLNSLSIYAARTLSI